jgi:hypothetical protein
MHPQAHLISTLSIVPASDMSALIQKKKSDLIQKKKQKEYMPAPPFESNRALAIL